METTEDNTYVTGTGQEIGNTHEETEDCTKYGCVIHNPSPGLAHLKTHWRADRRIMERICEHGIGHPDPDDMNYIRRTRGVGEAKAESVHGCDGCCHTRKRRYCSNCARIMEFDTSEDYLCGECRGGVIDQTVAEKYVTNL